MSLEILCAGEWVFNLYFSRNNKTKKSERDRVKGGGGKRKESLHGKFNFIYLWLYDERFVFGPASMFIGYFEVFLTGGGNIFEYIEYFLQSFVDYSMHCHAHLHNF